MSKYFQDKKNQEGIKLAMKLKGWCNNQECANCIFASDLDGSCQLIHYYSAPCQWDEEEIYKYATSEMED